VAADSPFAKMTFDEIFRARKPIRLAIPQPGTSDVWILEKTMEFFGLGAPGARTWSWRRLHASLADYDPSRGWLHLGVALHPGAERYYRERGWLK